MALAALGGLAGGAHAVQAQARALPPGAIRVERAEVIDRNGFEKPLVALTLFKPVGWRAEGGVEWDPTNTCGLGTRFNWRATAADNASAIQIVPQEKWNHGNFELPPNCLMSRVDGARAYLEWWVARNRRGARVLDYRDRPEMVEPYKALNSVTPMPGGELRSWVQAGEVLIGHTQGGRELREAISTIVWIRLNRFAPIGPNEPLQLLQGESLFGFAMRAPNGTLDFKTVDALRQSVRVGPEWNARMMQAATERHQIAMEAGRQMAADNLRGAQQRSQIIAQTAQDINDIQMGTWQNTSRTMDRTQRERIEAIRGVETYNDPHYGGTVQLSNHFEHAWQLRDGTYVLTNDVHFDPNRALGIEGQRLKRAQ
jgi:hypothetical protein